MFNMLLERLEADAEFVCNDKNEAWICEVFGYVHDG
jgi:rubrerythrin